MRRKLNLVWKVFYWLTQWLRRRAFSSRSDFLHVRYIRWFHHFQQMLLHLPNDPKWRNFEHFSNDKKNPKQRRRIITIALSLDFPPRGPPPPLWASLLASLMTFLISSLLPSTIRLASTYYVHNKRTRQIQVYYIRKAGALPEYFCRQKACPTFQLPHSFANPAWKYTRKTLESSYVYIRKKSSPRWL